MKIIMIIVLSLTLYASSKELSPSEYKSIHNHSNRPVLKMGKRSNMHKLHNVTEEEAKIIAKNETKEDVTSLKLTNDKRFLIYKIETEHYVLIINALDGTVMEKKEIKSYRY